jgi:hypothetical protein
MLTGHTTLDLALLHKQITAAVSLFYQAVAFASTHMPYLDEQWRNNWGWIIYALSVVNIVRVFGCLGYPCTSTSNNLVASLHLLACESLSHYLLQQVIVSPPA